MGIERILASQKGKECYELPSETKGKAKKNRRRQKKMSPVQRLYEICKKVFSEFRPGIVPPSDDIQRIKSVLDGMTEVDVGLSPNMPYFKRKANDQLPKITYLHIYYCDKFSIGIFCLPPSGVIPLHNHPGMTVFSKLLFGTMHIKAYDWAGDASSDVNTPGVRLAKVKVDSDFTAPCNTSVLYPADGGNMHCFTALTPCAVLDVLCPPYSNPDGRHCAYYLDFPFSSFADSVDGSSVPDEERECYAWLQERENPEDLTVGAPYNGPKIVEK
ncbi:Plant cysteine oxidase [Actinidia chinensis var. chinensis]|uniref:cysteine dioxygenase n=1 Tax=Actinidia chinensis var. chinensis TaxID=1590841 RepID=A0A2R6RUK8_ACTCC|nr:Plant cysteine oxidase [Actinidia chinensis var. chinensis]